jgi:hypothetical protein
MLLMSTCDDHVAELAVPETATRFWFPEGFSKTYWEPFHSNFAMSEVSNGH